MHSMEKNKKQWMKYTAVVLSFLIMAGLFMPGTKTQVNATGTESSVSGGNVISEEPVMTLSDSWSIKVNYVSDGVIVGTGSAEGTISSGATVVIATNIQPTKDKWTLAGWSYNGNLYEIREDTDTSILIEYNQNVTEITLEAQWRANPATVIYNANGSTFAQSEVTHEDISNTNLSIKIIESTPTKEGYIFNGWLYNGSSITADTEFSWNDFAGGTIKLEADWIEEEWDGKSITESGKTYSLKAGTPYTLGTGTWTVSGDDYSYTGGSTFYVGTDGDYTFTKN